MSEAPDFWFAARGPLAYALAPVAAGYGFVAGRRMMAKPSGSVEVPVLCVGNFTVGGAGKTPVALEVARIAAARGRRPGFLSRGYGGGAPMPLVVDAAHHTSRDVGDEPLMLAERYPTVVAPNRVAGAKLLAAQGIDFIVMDDGFQNPSLAKDLSIAVIGSRRGIGNGMPMPAGPLRADLTVQLSKTHAVAVIGRPGAAEHESARDTVRRAAKRALPILRASVQPLDGERFRGVKTLAFAGIADPDKFFDTLQSTGAEIVDRQSFGDHHVFDEDAIDDLTARAEAADLTLVTTEKDAARLRGTGEKADILLARTQVLRVGLSFEDEGVLRRLVDKTVARARERRLNP